MICKNWVVKRFVTIIGYFRQSVACMMINRNLFYFSGTVKKSQEFGLLIVMLIDIN